MRSKNAIRNLLVHLGYEVFVFALGIIFPRLIIGQFSDAVNGLTSMITRVLALINLAQAGAVGAAIYQMYKPVAENDYETQSAILYTSKRYYRRFTLVYLALALAAGVFYGFYLRSELSFTEIFLSFLILALNGAGSLLFNTMCDIYISPHQKKYYLTIAMFADQIVRYGLMAVVLLCRLHFLFLYVAYLAGGLTSVAVNLYFYRKLSRGKITNDPKDKHFRIPDRGYLMMSSIGSEAVTASPSVIVSTVTSRAASAVSGLEAASVFSVYALVFTSMKTILNSIQLSLSAIFGNLVKTSDDAHIRGVYEAIALFTVGIGAVAAACVGFLLTPFVSLYVQNVTEIDYVYFILVVFVTAYTVVFAFRTAFSYVATVYGLFKQTCTITLSFGIAGILISVACVYFFGMPYVMCGLLFNQLGCALTTLYVLRKKVDWFRIGRLMADTALMLLMAAGGLTAYAVWKPAVGTWFCWVKYGVLSALIAVGIFGVYCILFRRATLQKLIGYGMGMLRKKRKV